MGQFGTKPDGSPAPGIRVVLKPLLAMFHGEKGCKLWKRTLDAGMKTSASASQLIQVIAPKQGLLKRGLPSFVWAADIVVPLRLQVPAMHLWTWKYYNILCREALCRVVMSQSGCHISCSETWPAFDLHSTSGCHRHQGCVLYVCLNTPAHRHRSVQGGSRCTDPPGCCTEHSLGML